MTQTKWLLALLTSLLLISMPASADDDDWDDDYRPKKTQNHKAKKTQKTTRKNIAHINSQRAAQIAQNRIKGGRVVNVERDDGAYEVDVVSGRAKYEVRINARTGRVIRIKRDD